MWIVEALDVIEDVGASLVARAIASPVHSLNFQTREEAFHGGVVPVTIGCEPLVAEYHELHSLCVALCWVAAPFYRIYVRNYEAPAILILVAFFAHFISKRESGDSEKGDDPSRFLRQRGSSPIRELSKGLAWLIGYLLVGLGIGMKIPDVQLGVAIALSVVVIGVVAFVLFRIRALSAWGSDQAS